MTKFNVGDRVTVRDTTSLFHTRTQAFIRGRTGVVVSIRPDWVIPEDEAWGRPYGRKEPFYNLRFRQTDLWPNYAGSPVDTLETEASERWLMPAGRDENQ
jgi:hypothetical protein